jgi:hypothetical protein
MLPLRKMVARYLRDQFQTSLHQNGLLFASGGIVGIARKRCYRAESQSSLSAR